MDKLQQNLEAYIQKLLNLQDVNHETQILSEAELKDLAIEMGLTEKEWQDLQRDFDDHLTRGKGFIEYDNLQDAETELKQALAIRPYDLQVLDLLMQLYHQRWEAKRSDKDKASAMQYARLCLKVKPDHQPALILISSYRNPPPKPKQPVPVQRGFIFLGILAAVVLIVMIGLSIVQTPTAPEAPVYPEGQTDTQGPVSTEAQLDFPFEWTEDANSEVLRFYAEGSDLSKYDGSYSYKFRGAIHSETHEISRLRVIYELINQDGTVIVQSREDVIDDSDPTARPGDIIPLHWHEFEKTKQFPDFKEARLRIDLIQSQLAPESYEEGPEVKITWEPEQPRNVNLLIRERKFSDTKNDLFKSHFEKFEWAFSNTGNLDLELVKMEVRWYNASDDLIDAETHYLVGPSDPKFLRGQRRISGRTFGVKDEDKGPISRREFVITEVDY